MAAREPAAAPQDAAPAVGRSWVAQTIPGLCALALIVACGNVEQNRNAEGVRANTPATMPGPVVATQAIDLAAGDERLGVCQSFRLNNDDWLFVSGVTLEATPGVHHSDWFVYPEAASSGPDGSADCPAFDFGTASGGMPAKGGLIFSQSTQSSVETQSFGEGAAFAVPPHSQLFVSFHLLNTSLDTLRIKVSAALQVLPELDVKIRLIAGGGLMGLLAIPPLARSRFYTDCTFAAPPTFKSYFMLPHYHRVGTGMRLELVGGTRDGEVVWQNEGSIGEALGSRIAPAVDFTGATGFRFSCAYQNDTTQTIHSGPSGSDEMCSFYVHTDSPEEFYGIAGPGFGTPQLVDHGTNEIGEHLFSVDGCALLMR